MTNHPHHVADALDTTADLCRIVEPAGWAAEDRADVLESAKALAIELPGLTARIRAVATGQRRRCGEPPDLDGLCLACGSKIARPVADHDRGCFLAPARFVARMARRIPVRAARYVRSVGADLRGAR